MKTQSSSSQATPVTPARGRSQGPGLLVLTAILLSLITSQAPAQIRVDVHAEFPTSGFADGPVFETSGPEIFDVSFLVDESAAVHYAAGFEAAPGIFLAHDIYAIQRDAITGSTFSFGNATFQEPYLHNLSFALLAEGVIAAPMFLSDITPGSTPFIEVGALAVFLGSYDFGPFVFGAPRSVFLTNGATAFDGIHQAFGEVSVRVSAVPVPAGLPMLLSSLLGLAWSARRRAQRDVQSSI